MLDRIEDAWKTVREHPAVRAGAVYSGSAFVLLQVMDLLGLATATVRWTGLALAAGLVFLVAGFVVGDYRVARALPAPGAALALARVPRGRRLAASVALLFAIGTGAWWAGSRLVAAPVAPGAEAIAVLPFTVSGPGTDALGEGMVDLLSVSLDQVGGVRAIHPRTVLHQWARHASGGTLDLPGALALGRDVGAGSVLLGSLVGAGDRIRLTAELFTLDGRRIGEARSEGEAGDVLALVDDLAVRILREVWRSREPLPGLRLEAITTSSVEALQHYLAGERHYRAARWDSARVAFDDAIRADPDFALAHYRSSEVLGWVHHHGHPDVAASARIAAGLADRLPARERSLVRADLLHTVADAAALDSAEAYVRRYPDDPLGWALLADIRFHAQVVLGVDTDDIHAATDSVGRLDPGLSAPWVHAMELAYMAFDSARYDAALERFEDAGGEAAHWREQVPVVWAPADSAEARFRRAFPVLALDRAAGPTWNMWALSPVARPALDPDLTDRILTGLSAGDRPGATEAQVVNLRIHADLARGRVDRALDEARRAIHAGMPLWSAFNPMLDAAMIGIVPGEPVRALGYGRVAAPIQPYHDWAYALAAGDARLAASLEPDLDTFGDDLPEWAPGWFRAMQGVQLLIAGETQRGLAMIRDGARQAGYSGPANQNLVTILFSTAVRMVDDDATRDEGIRRLEIIRVRGGPMFRAPASHALGRAYEARGDRPAAAHHYGEVVRLWNDADPHLQPAVETARRALGRLGAEAR